MMKEVHARKLVASIGDTCLWAIEPWGALLEASWGLGYQIGDVICRGILKKEASPAAEEVAGSLVMFPVMLLRYWGPNDVLVSIAQSAAAEAQKDASGLCKTENEKADRSETYIYVPPVKWNR
jgi:hypothetical protein